MAHKKHNGARTLVKSLPIAVLSTYRLISYYLMSSYLYYVQNTSAISDANFDELCTELLARWDEADHPHKHLIDKNSLEAGTGYAVPSYPLRVQNAAMRWLRTP